MVLSGIRAIPYGILNVKGGTGNCGVKGQGFSTTLRQQECLKRVRS